MDEIASLTPSYGGITYAAPRRWRESSGRARTENHPGTPILHIERFATASGKAKLMPLSFRDVC